MMGFELRDYQDKIVHDTRSMLREGHRSVVLVSPTGSGKGVLLPFIAHGLVKNGKRVLIMAHRQNLVDQLEKAVSQFGVAFSRIRGNQRVRYNCMIGMTQSVVSRLDKIPAPDYILTDEGHHGTSPTNRKIYDYFPNATRLFLTATPIGADGEGLSSVASAMVLGPAVKWLIEQEHLARYTYIKPKNNIDISRIKFKGNGDVNEKSAADEIKRSFHVGDAVEKYLEWMKGKPCIVFCSGIKHAEEVAEAYCAAGIKASAISGTMKRSEIKKLIEGLSNGSVEVLCSADLIGEGTDIPCLQGIQMLRPTKSIVIFLQQCGRALRPKPDGSYAIIIDHVGNNVDLGFPCDERDWSLEGKPKKEVPIKTCERCSRSFHAHEAREEAGKACGDDVCPLKSFEHVAKPREVVREVIDDEMEVINDPWEWAGGIQPAQAFGEELQALIAKADTEEKLKQIARARGYKPAWWIRQAELKGLRKPVKKFWK